MANADGNFHVNINLRAKGKRRLLKRLKIASEVLNNKRDPLNGDPGVNILIRDPGDGGPCGPEKINMEVDAGFEDLPEARSRGNA